MVSALKRISYTICMLLLLILVSCQDTTEGYKYNLRKRPDGTMKSNRDFVVCIEKDPDSDFVILNLSDIQNGGTLTAKNKAIIQQLVSDVKPHLITITGDHTYGKDKSFMSFCNYIDSFDIPWAPIFGNHDHEERSFSIKKQGNIFLSCKNCIFKPGPSLGSTFCPVDDTLHCVQKSGNYIVNITQKEGQNSYVLKSLVFMDSGSHKDGTEPAQTPKFNSSTYDSLNTDQLTFFTDCMQSVQQYGKNGQVDAFLFIHIPISAYAYALNAALKTDKDFFTNSSSFLSYAKTITYDQSFNPDLWNNGYKNSFGVYHETFSGSRYNDHVFETVKPYTSLIVAGHDHDNNFVIDYENVKLCYAQKTGDGCYWDEPFGKTGGTVIKIKQDGSFTLEHKLIPMLP